MCCGGAGGSLTGLTGSGGGVGFTHLFSIWEKFFSGWAGGLEEWIFSVLNRSNRSNLAFRFDLV